jgi:uncharacterized protein (DUF2252 family)
MATTEVEHPVLDGSRSLAGKTRVSAQSGAHLASAAHLTVDERRARGRAARERAPRSSHASWVAPPDRPDPVALLEEQASTRLPDLVPLRYARMAVSPFAFLRGSAKVMAHDLASRVTTGITTQLCGDCHLANFGAYASPERVLLADINDFDETLPGPFEWDVKRLAASLWVAGRGNGVSEPECRSAVLATVQSYRDHVTAFSGMRTMDIWYSRVTVDDLLALIADKRRIKLAEKNLTKIRQRTSLQDLSKLTTIVDGHRVIVDNPPLVARVTEDQLGAELRTLFDLYRQSLPAAERHVLQRFQIADVARKVVGVGSVGTRCFITLLVGRDDDDPLFLQVKQAEASVLEPFVAKSAYQHQGERVVVGQKLMQAASDIFLGWMSGPGGRHFYWRQLRDMKGSVELETYSASDFVMYGSVCGWALARAHARAGDPVEIGGYLGTSDSFDRAIASFAEAYANQTERDYKALLNAIKTGRIASTTLT